MCKKGVFCSNILMFNFCKDDALWKNERKNSSAGATG